MIGYVTLGTNDMARGAELYDALAKEMGVGRMMENDNFIAWGAPGGGAASADQAVRRQARDVGNGVMVALAAKDRAHVDRIYKLRPAGRHREGAPGRGADSTPPISAIWTATSSTPL